MVVTLSGMVTLVRLLSLNAAVPNGRNAVANGHAGEAVVLERSGLNGRDAVWNGHAGEVLSLNAESQWS